jgi:patatin-like phospholipase/acyl hydrolase
MTFRILACDGGGIRGYLSSRLIQELNTATKGKFLKSVDGYAGTSTGSLISIALASGKLGIDQLVTIYKTEGPTIFQKTPYLTMDEVRAEFGADCSDMSDEELLSSGPGYIWCQYISAGLRTILTPYLGADTFSSISKVIAVNTAQMWDTSQSPPRWMPVTLNNQKVGADYDSVELIDGAMASAAAPTYFPPHEISGLGYFADGGTFANDPVLNGVEVVIASGKAKLADIEVISIGTGQSPAGIQPSQIGETKYWGAARWMGVFPFGNKGVPFGAMFNMSLELASINAGKTTQRMLGDQMVRVNPVLDSQVKLDDYSPADYKTMEKAVTAAMKSPEWAAAVKMVNGW